MTWKTRIKNEHENVPREEDVFYKKKLINRESDNDYSLLILKSTHTVMFLHAIFKANLITNLNKKQKISFVYCYFITNL